MPAGPPICALRASARPTSDSGFSGWPTPNAGPQNDTDSLWQDRRERLAKQYGNNGFGLTLGMAVTLAGWQTPTVADAKDSQYTYSRGNHGDVFLKLPGQALLAGWSTPTSRDHKDTAPLSPRPDGTPRHDQLPRQAFLTGWNTPRATDGSHGGPNQSGGALPHDASLTRGSTPLLSSAPPRPMVDADGAAYRLNPKFSLWLQGYPATWGDFAAPVTPSSRKSRSSSSPRGSRRGD